MKKHYLILFVAVTLFGCNGDEVEGYIPSSEYLNTDPSIVLNGTTAEMATVNADGQWSLTIDQGSSSESWIVVSRTSGNGSTDLMVNAATKNPSPTEDRTGRLVIRTAKDGIVQVINVKQYSGDETFSVGSAETIPFGNLGGEQTVPVNCNTSWEVNGGQSWCRVVKTSEKEVKITVDENPDETERTSTFVFTSARKETVRLTIVQSLTYQDLYFTASPTNTYVSCDGGTFDIDVLASVEWRMTLSDSWLKVYNGGSLANSLQGKGDSNIVLNVEKNDDTEERVAVITFDYSIRGEFKTQTCIITQEPAQAPDPWDNPTPGY